MELRQLRYFSAVAEHGSFSRAAGVVHISQPALTQGIAKLEAELNVRLFERSAFGVTLTAAGKILLRRARLASAEIGLAHSELAAFRGAPSSLVRVGIEKTLVSGVIATALAKFAACENGFSLAVIEGWALNLSRRLSMAEVDFVVTSEASGHDENEALTAEPIYDRLGSVMISQSHPLLKRDCIRVSDLYDCLWVVTTSDISEYDRVERAFAVSGMSLPPHIMMTDSDGLKNHLVREGVAVGMVAVQLLNREVSDGQLVQLDLPGFSLNWPVYLKSRKTSPLQPLAAALARDIRLAVRAATFESETQIKNARKIQVRDD